MKETDKCDHAQTGHITIRSKYTQFNLLSWPDLCFDCLSWGKVGGGVYTSGAYHGHNCNLFHHFNHNNLLLSSAIICILFCIFLHKCWLEVRVLCAARLSYMKSESQTQGREGQGRNNQFVPLFPFSCWFKIFPHQSHEVAPACVLSFAHKMARPSSMGSDHQMDRLSVQG